MAKNKGCAQCTDPSRLNKVGGQAVLEGVMMKAGKRTVTSCRKEDGSITVYDDVFESVRENHKILNIPIIRGVINFFEMMKLSVRTLNNSADALGIEEQEGKCERWLKKHFGVGITDVVMFVGVILGVILALSLFLVLPKTLTQLIDNYIANGSLGIWSAVIEGGMKILIFISYLLLVSLIPDIKRTFMYHGAEHKSIACFEAGAPLTPESAKNYTRFHPRCGTSFMFFMIAIGIAAGILIEYILPGLDTWKYVVMRLLILPLVVGLGYEIIMLAGKHNNIITRILSAPGLWVQRITTKEPTLDMLEVAIVSIKCALRDEFSEFAEFYENRGWEKQDAESEEAESAGEQVFSESEGENAPATDACCDIENKAPDCPGTYNDADEPGDTSAEKSEDQ